MLCLLSRVALSLSINSITIPQPDDGDFVPIPISNASLFANPKFGIGYQKGKWPMNEVSTYMNVLRAMEQQGRLDVQEDLTKPTLVSFPPWNDVILVASPKDLKIQRKYVIWGLSESLHYLVENNFQCGSFLLRLDGETVGYLIYKPEPTPPEPSLATTLSNAAERSSLSRRNRNASGADANETPDIAPGYIIGGRRLSKAGTFYPFAKALQFLSAFHIHDSIESFDAQDDIHHTAVQFQNLGKEHGGPSATASDFITAIWETAKFVANNNNYAELRADIEIVGRTAGRLMLKVVRGLNEMVTSETQTL